MAKISVIMPVYNSMDYLEDSIGSVLGQTYKDFELIIIDDGSKDDSFKICDRFAKKDDRVRLFHVENQGVSAARNLGISKSTGEYIRFMDADDTFHENSLKLMIGGMESDDRVDIVIGGYDTNDENLYTGDLEGLKSIEFMVNHYTSYIPSFYYGVTWNKLYKADIIKDNRLAFELGINWSEDFLFNIAYYEKCRYVYYIKEPVYYYYRRSNTLVSSINEYSVDAALDIEMRRFMVSRELVLHKSNKKETINDVYNFLLSRVNLKLNEILYIKDKSKKEKYKLFCYVLDREDVHSFIRGCPYKNDYFLNNYLISSVRKGKYRGLFMLYKFKYMVKKNKHIHNFLTKEKRILPKFPL